MAAGPGRRLKLKKRGWTNPNAALELRDAGLKCARSIFKHQRESYSPKNSSSNNNNNNSRTHPNILRLKKLGLMKFLQDAWQWQQGNYCEDFARNYDPTMKRTEVGGGLGIVVDLSLEGFVRMTGLNEGDVVAPIDAHLKNFSCEQYFPAYSIVPKKNERVYDMRLCKEKEMQTLVSLLVRTMWLKRQCTHAPAGLMYLVCEAEAGRKVNWGRVLYTVFINEVNRLHGLLSVNKKTTTCAGPLMCFLTARSACEQQIAIEIPPPMVSDNTEPESDNEGPTRRKRRRRRTMRKRRRHAEDYTSDEEEDDYEEEDEDDDEEEEGSDDDNCTSDGEQQPGKSIHNRISPDMVVGPVQVQVQPHTPLRVLCHRSPLTVDSGSVKVVEASTPPPRPPPEAPKKYLGRGGKFGTSPSEAGVRVGDTVSSSLPLQSSSASDSPVQRFRSAMTEKRADLHKRLNDLLRDTLEQDDVYTGMLGEWEATLKEVQAWRSAGLGVGASNPTELQAANILRKSSGVYCIDELRRYQQLGRELLSARDSTEMGSILRHKLNSEEQATKLYKVEQEYAAQCLKAQLHAESVAEVATAEIKALRAEVQELKARGFGNAVTEQFPKEQTDKLRARLEEAILQKEALAAERDKLLQDLRVQCSVSMVSQPRAFMVSPDFLIDIKEECIQTRHST